MGVNNRHKKVLKSERAKVKLKSTKTKFLPKGQNVTNTNFKIKPIVVPEQLQQRGADEVLSKRKLNVKDILSRIKHHNENIRYKACEDLAEIITGYTDEIVTQHLSSVCLAVGYLMQDKEVKVRKSAIKCLQSILKHVSGGKLAPFFSYFSTNLRCAMTNIDKNIQEDSLHFLDCFIDLDCGFISKSYEKLMPDFLSLISKLRNESQPGRRLTVNLAGKMTSSTWRIKVLSRLRTILSIILDDEQKGQCVATQKLSYDTRNCSIFPILKKDSWTIINEPISMFFSSNRNVSVSAMDSMNRHIVTLVPLLYETWVEVMPEKSMPTSSSESFSLNEEMGALLTCITNTLYLLWHYVNKIENEEINLNTVFNSSEGRKFLDNLLSNFPYIHTGQAGRRKPKNSTKILEHNNDPKCTQENVIICFLYLTLHVKCTHQKLKPDSEKIFSYINQLFSKKGILSEGTIQCFMELLIDCLGQDAQKWTRCGVKVQLILESAIDFYRQGKMNDVNKSKLLQTLCNIYQKNRELTKTPKYQTWLRTLPDILCQPTVIDTTLVVLVNLSKSNCKLFQKALVEKLPEIIENLEKLRIIPLTGDKMWSYEHQAKVALASIFFHIPAYGAEKLATLRHFAESSQSEFAPYFKHVLSLRKQPDK